MKLRMHPGTCEHCGGSANWTMINGVMHYFCVEQCAGFRQLELNLGDPVVQDPLDQGQREASRMVYRSLDRSGKLLPTEDPEVLPLSPTQPAEASVPGSLDPHQLRLKDMYDGLTALQKLLDDLAAEAYPALPWSDDLK